MLEAKNALLSAGLNLMNRGFLIYRMSKPRIPDGFIKFHLQVYQDRQGIWCVYLTNEAEIELSVAVRYPLGIVVGDKRQPVSVEAAAMEQRLIRALLATLLHPQMYTPSTYASDQGIEVILWDRAVKYPTPLRWRPDGVYIVRIEWQKTLNVRLTREFLLTSAFEVVNVDISGNCPICHHQLNDLTGMERDFGGHWDGVDKHGHLTGGMLERLIYRCPQCNTKLMSKQSPEKVGIEGICWSVEDPFTTKYL